MSHKLEIIAEPGKPHIEFRRAFDAPRELVWEALTKPEHVRRWYGPRRMTTVVCEMDFRVGGKWRVVFRTPDGREAGFSGEYLLIEAPVKMQQTWRFEMFPDAVSVETMELEAHGDRTIMRGTVTHTSVANRDAHFGSGMEEGARETYERLDELLAELAAKAKT